MAEFGISALNVYNMDEKGTMLGMSGKEKVYLVARKEVKKARAGGVKQSKFVLYLCMHIF